MTSEYQLRCSMCGVTQEVEASSVGDLTAAKQGNSVHICDTCQRKVQFDSEQKFK